MNKPELVIEIANRLQLTRVQAEAAVNAVLDTITTKVAAGEDVTLHGFGTFKRVHKPERQAVNPATREPVTVPAKDVPQFKAAGAFEAAVNGSKATVAAA